MSESDVLPFLTHEWRLASEIARDVYEAEGQRGEFRIVRIRVNRNLRVMEKHGKVERKAATEDGGMMTPMMWRLARWTASRGPPSATRSGPRARWTSTRWPPRSGLEGGGPRRRTSRRSSGRWSMWARSPRTGTSTPSGRTPTPRRDRAGSPARSARGASGDTSRPTARPP